MIIKTKISNGVKRLFDIIFFGVDPAPISVKV